MGSFSDRPVDALTQGIADAIRDAVKNVSEPIIAEAMAKIERDLRERVGGIAARVVGQLSYERFGADLRITVKFENR